MPGMSGLEVAEEVKARKPWTPVVIITGYASDASESRAKAAGVVSFLQKPLSPEMIEGSARDALAAPPAAAEPAAPPAAVVEAPPAESGGVGGALMNIALFFAAPFIGLAYVVALPFVGLGFLAVMAARAAAARFELVNKVAEAFRTIGLMIAAPFIGLAAVVLFPFVGLAMLAWMGGRSVLGEDAPAKK